MERRFLNQTTAKSTFQFKNFRNKIVVECVGGSAYNTLSRVLGKLDIINKFDWLNIQEDPFFHSIGKYNKDPKGNSCFYDYSVDATVICKKQNGENSFAKQNRI